MFEASLFMPVIARSYMASLKSSMIMTPMFAFYLVLFSIIMSTLLALLFTVVVETPLIDFIKLLWFRSRIEKLKINKPDKAKQPPPPKDNPHLNKTE